MTFKEFIKMYYNITSLDIPKEIYMRTIYSSRRSSKEPSSRRGSIIFSYFFIFIIELVFCIVVLKKYFFALYIPLAVISILVQLSIDRFSFIYYFLAWHNYNKGTKIYKTLLTKYCGPEEHYILEDNENKIRYIIKRKGNRSFWKLKLIIHKKGKSTNIVSCILKKGCIYLKKAKSTIKIDLTPDMDLILIEGLIKKELLILFNPQIEKSRDNSDESTIDKSKRII